MLASWPAALPSVPVTKLVAATLANPAPAVAEPAAQAVPVATEAPAASAAPATQAETAGVATMATTTAT